MSAVSVRRLVGLSLSVALSLSAPVAFAKGKKDSAGSSKKNEKKKVLVGAFDGPKSDQARRAVISALKDDGEYDVSESTDAKPGADDKSYAKASGGAAAVLVGTVKKGTGLTISVHNGADGALIQDVDIAGDSAAKLSKNIGDTLTVSVADAIAQTKAGSSSDSSAKPEKAAKAKDKDENADKDKEEKPADEEEKAEPKGDEAAPSAPGTGPSPLELDVGFRAVHRSFSYHDTPAQLYPAAGYPSPLTYQLPLGPAAFIDGGVYPLAFGSSKQTIDFGLVGGFELGFATKSVFAENTPNQRELTTKSAQLYAGATGRYSFDVHQVQLMAAYGQQAFTLLGGSGLIPNVAYKFIRVGADARFRFDNLLFGFHVGTRIVSDTGQLKREWFPSTKTQALEAGLMAGYRITPNLDLIAGVDLLRYAFNFNPIPNRCVPPMTIANACTDPALETIAGGAVDQYISGFLGARYSLGSHAQ